MEKNIIFGPELKLPSIDGIRSGCENELYLLMKEVDLAFERKHKDLLKEVSDLKVLHQAKINEIENLKSVVESRAQGNRESLEEHTKYLTNELKKLKEENAELKKENQDFRNKMLLHKETENQLNSTKRSLNIQQENNLLLKNQFEKLSQQHGALQQNYQNLLNVLTLEQKIGSSELNANTLEQKTNSSGHRLNLKETASNLVQALIAEEIEENFKEESKHSEVLQSKMSEEIEVLRRTARDEPI